MGAIRFIIFALHELSENEPDNSSKRALIFIDPNGGGLNILCNSKSNRTTRISPLRSRVAHLGNNMTRNTAVKFESRRNHR